MGLSASRYNGVIMSGKEFNQLHKQIRLVKLTNSREHHNGLRYKTGLNIDIKPFNPSGSCEVGGMYFVRESEMSKWIIYNNKKIRYMRDVIIPDDAKVYIEHDKFKANQLILGQRKNITKETYLESVKYCRTNLLHVPKKIVDKEFCLEVVKHNGYTISYI